ncbi:hypothetical protein BY458DRAFT_476677 [Sporodiniella umbellata]|nr:hypothetical protein BY458DRAFT_476677 [Sporodiniella umbellata]
MEKELIQKVTDLVNELALQQQNNQHLALGLSKQLTEIKQKANNQQCSLDEAIVTLPEQRDEAMELLQQRLEKALSEEKVTKERNQELEKEREELKKVLGEYEQNLVTVTNKFRVYASDVSEGQLQLRREYNALLEAEKGTTSALLMENIMLQSQLSELAKVLRLVKETSSFDNPYEQRIAQLEQEKRDLLNIVGLSTGKNEIDRVKTSPSPTIPKNRASGLIEEFFTE